MNKLTQFVLAAEAQERNRPLLMTPELTVRFRDSGGMECYRTLAEFRSGFLFSLEEVRLLHRFLGTLLDDPEEQ